LDVVTVKEGKTRARAIQRLHGRRKFQDKEDKLQSRTRRGCSEEIMRERALDVE